MGSEYRPPSVPLDGYLYAGRVGKGEESGHLSDRRVPLPEEMIGNHAESYQKAQRRAYHQ